MPRKQRPRGEGTLTYDERRKRWIYKLPPDEAGRRPQVSGKTQGEALEKAKALRAKREAGVSTGGRQPTVEAWGEVWLAHVESKRKASTAHTYRQMLRQHINPALGAIRLDKVTGDHVQAWVDQMHADGYARDTIRNAHARLRSMLALATRRRRIPYNPALDIELPPVDDDAEPRGKAISLRDAQALLAAADAPIGNRGPHRLAAIYHVLLGLGLRRGEALGLAWRAVDFAAGTLTIVQQVQAINGKTVISRGAKSRTSRRTLPIPPPVLSRLEAHRANQIEERRHLGADWKEHGLVFATERGTPISPNTFWARFRKLCKRAGITPPRIHDLRHTCASALGRHGANRDQIGAILGHTANDVTGRYVHVTLDEMRVMLGRVCAELYATPGGGTQIADADAV